MGMQIKVQGRASYPSLWTPKPFDPADPPHKHRYGIHVIFSKTDVATETLIRNACRSALVGRFGAKATETYEMLKGTNRLCLHDGDFKSNDSYRGCWFVSAYSKFNDPPLVVNRDPLLRELDGVTPKIDPLTGAPIPNRVTEASGIIYAGCWVNVTMDVFYSQTGNACVTAGLKGVQFVKDGDSFGGGVKAKATDFSPVAPMEACDLV